ncbi:MAG: hypothetical protein ACK5M3_08550 [Dysgonomonas sp.]
MRTKDLILSPFFIIGLITLILNDFYFKYEYGNFITGKLSDFSGLLIFPMFLATIIPKLKKSASLVTGIGFIIWKLPLFTPVIDSFNQLSPVTIHRVIDYTDYIALLVLPLSHYLINYINYSFDINWVQLKNFSKYSLLVIAFFSFCATSVAMREIPRGTIYIGESHTIKLPIDSVISSIKRMGYDCHFHEKDSTEIRSIDYFQTDNVIRYYGDSSILDTIANIKYQLTEINPNKTRLTIINVTLSKEGSIQNWKKLKAVSKQYNIWLKENFIEKIKK